jgi:hypothetical protein
MRSNSAELSVVDYSRKGTANRASVELNHVATKSIDQLRSALAIEGTTARENAFAGLLGGKKLGYLGCGFQQAMPSPRKLARIRRFAVKAQLHHLLR